MRLENILLLLRNVLNGEKARAPLHSHTPSYRPARDRIGNRNSKRIVGKEKERQNKEGQKKEKSTKSEKEGKEEYL